MRRRFKDLSPPEVLALAISLEEEDGRIFQEFARRLRSSYPKAAETLDSLRKEEDCHRHALVELFRRKYGDEIPLIRRQDVSGFVRREVNYAEHVAHKTVIPMIARRTSRTG